MRHLATATLILVSLALFLWYSSAENEAQASDCNEHKEFVAGHWFPIGDTMTCSDGTNTWVCNDRWAHVPDYWRCIVYVESGYTCVLDKWVTLTMLDGGCGTYYEQCGPTNGNPAYGSVGSFDITDC